MTPFPELTLERVGRRFAGGMWGAQDVSLTFTPGVTGLLGPNGAGKSTLMRMLATLDRPTAGDILWNGTPYDQAFDTVRKTLGFLPQDFRGYDRLSAEEFLTYLAASRGIDARVAARRIEELLERLNLLADRSVPMRSLSGGTRQRVGIAQSLLSDPALLIIDEPTGALDPEERARIRHLIVELAGERIIILSTHIVSDIEATASRIVVLHEGRVLWQGSVEALLAVAQGRAWEWVVPPEQLAQVRRAHRLSHVARRFDGLHVRAVADRSPDPAALPVEPTVEEAYLVIVNGARE